MLSDYNFLHYRTFLGDVDAGSETIRGYLDAIEIIIFGCQHVVFRYHDIIDTGYKGRILLDHNLVNFAIAVICQRYCRYVCTVGQPFTVGFLTGVGSPFAGVVADKFDTKNLMPRWY